MKKKKTKKRRRVILLIAEIILILLLTLLLFAVVKLSKIQKTKLDMDQVAINEDLSSETMDAMSDYRTVALFGLDNRTNNSLSKGRSDVIMLANINNKRTRSNWSPSTGIPIWTPAAESLKNATPPTQKEDPSRHSQCSIPISILQSQIM